MNGDQAGELLANINDAAFNSATVTEVVVGTYGQDPGSTSVRVNLSNGVSFEGTLRQFKKTDD